MQFVNTDGTTFWAFAPKQLEGLWKVDYKLIGVLDDVTKLSGIAGDFKRAADFLGGLFPGTP